MAEAELSERASTVQQVLTQGGITVAPAAAVMGENADEEWISQGLPSLALGKGLLCSLLRNRQNKL